MALVIYRKRALFITHRNVGLERNLLNIHMSLGWKWVDGTTLTDKEMSMESPWMLRYEQRNIHIFRDSHY